MLTAQFKVAGMTCGGCTSNVTKTLETVTGVNEVIVSLSENQATVIYDEKLTNLEQLKSAVIKAGYGVNPSKTNHEPQRKGCCE